MGIGIKERLLVLSLLPRRLRFAVMERRYAREIEQTGEAELPYLRRLLKRGDLAIDVGSNLGVYTYELSRVTGRVIAFEPNPGLARLVRSLGLDGVEVRQAAASDTAREAQLFVPEGRFGFAMATLLPAANKGDRGERIKIATQRLDDVADDVRFIKIDVEGFEELALAGAERLLTTVRPICLIEIEERHNAAGLSRITAGMVERDYSGFFLQNGAWQPIARFDQARDQDTAADDATGAQSRRSLSYVNNFLFVPTTRVAEFDFLP